MPRHRSNQSISVDPSPQDLVILLAAGTHASPRKETVDELAVLLRDLRFRVVCVARQRRPPAGSVVGPGKLEELAELIAECETAGQGRPSLVIAADQIPAGQLAHLEKALGVTVRDRTDVILMVFEARARSRLARLEIELARLTHQLPRIRDHRDLGDKEGGGGRGGRGHSNVELSKQRVRRRIADLRREVDLRRAQRRRTTAGRHALPTVALVGYTNAGKSAWMQALTGSAVHVEDKLFATLDTTVRAITRGPNQRVLIADTVGFLGDLPHALVESFRSTLDEALEADLLLHVADASHPRFRDHIEVTQAVLDGLSGASRRQVLLLNKVDRLSPDQQKALQGEFPEALLVSSHDADDVHEVASWIRAFVEDELETTAEVF